MVVPVWTTTPVAVKALTAAGTEDGVVESCGVPVNGGSVSRVTCPFKVRVMTETDCATAMDGTRIEANSAREETMVTARPVRYRTRNSAGKRSNGNSQRQWNCLSAAVS